MAKRRIKYGISQWNKPTPKRVRDIIDIITYTLAGVAGFSFMSHHAEVSTILLFLAGGIEKFAPRFIGETETNPTQDEQTNQ